MVGDVCTWHGDARGGIALLGQGVHLAKQKEGMVRVSKLNMCPRRNLRCDVYVIFHKIQRTKTIVSKKPARQIVYLGRVEPKSSVYTTPKECLSDVVWCGDARFR